MKKFELFYHVVNGGDGSAFPRFFMSEAAAEKAEEAQQEEGEGWGESSVGSVELTIIDGVVHYVGSRWDAKKKEHIDFTNPLPVAE